MQGAAHVFCTRGDGDWEMAMIISVTRILLGVFTKMHVLGLFRVFFVFVAYP
jgi:hypothetical protein